MPIRNDSERLVGQTVEHFIDLHKPSYRWLLYYAALPLILTPELLHYLRHTFSPRTPWLAEVDVLLAESLCRQYSTYEQYLMHADVRAYLLNEARAQPEFRLAQAAQVLLHYIRDLERTRPYKSWRDLQSQAWSAMVYIDNEHRRTVVEQVKEEFRHAGVTERGGSADLMIGSELERLAHLTEQLAPELAQYPELLDYARYVGALVRNEPAVGDRAYQPILGEDMPSPAQLTGSQVSPKPGEPAPPRQALEAASAIGDEGSRANALAAVAAQLEGEPALLRQALEAASAIGDEGSRAHALAAVVGKLEGEPALLRQALEAASAIGDEGSRANVLAAVVGKLEGEPALLRQALEAASAIGDEGSRANVLAAVVGKLEGEPALLRQALEAASAIGDEGSRANVLAAVVGKLDRDLAVVHSKVGDKGGEAMTLSNLGGVYDALGEKDRALAYYEQALPLSRQAGDKAGEAVTLSNIGGVYDALGEKDRALAYYEQALPLSRQAGDKAGEAMTLSNLGGVYDALGEKDRALAYYEQALPLRRQAGDKAGEAVTLSNIGGVYDALGEKDRALAYYEQALPLSRQAGDKAGEAVTLSNLGGVYDALGEKDRALAYYEQALPLRRQAGDKAGEAVTLSNIGGVYDALGEKDRALAYYEQALPLRRQVGDKAGEAVTLNNLGRVYDALGEKDRALECYEQALPLSLQVGDKAGEAVTLSNIGGVYDALGEKDRALAYYEQALPLRRQVGDKAGEAVTLNNLGRVYDALGEKYRALECYEQALPLLREVGDEGQLAAAEAAQAAAEFSQEMPMSDGETQQTPPRVFISYAQYEPAHSQRVLALAHALAADGLDVELDQFHGQEIIDWPRWCVERLKPENTDFVLLVCTAEYRRRIEGRVELDQGRGVFWEGNLIYGYLYRAKANERLVPLLLDDEPESSLPLAVANWNHFRLRDFGLQNEDQGYEGLYRLLTGQPATAKPEVYVSYAWARERQDQLVEALFDALVAQGLRIRRDSSELHPGDRIYRYMERLSAGRCVVVLLSEAYLRSEYCMTELYRIYTHARQRDKNFPRRIVLLVQGDAHIGSVSERLAHAVHWKSEHDKLDTLIREHGPEVIGADDFLRFKLIGEFYRHVGDMLSYANDVLMPRDRTTLSRDGFAMVKGLIDQALA